MRPIPRRAELIAQRQLRVRLFFILFIYPVALLAITTIGFRNLSSFVSLAESKAAVQTGVANGAFAFLHSGGVSPHESITGFRRLADMSERRRNAPAAAFSLFAPPMPQSGDSKIVFASNRDGSMQIYVMNGDGSAITRLTFSGANDDYPRWSPNAAKILFQSDRDHSDTGYMDIYVMNSDGSGVTRLTNDPNDDGMASWSPDGSKIGFQSMRNGVNYQVYSMNADGSNQVNLSNSSSSDGAPSWSPDGSKIAFATDRDHPGYDGIYVMNSDGTNQHALTSGTGELQDTQPAWSPDGNKIAFVSTRDSSTETWQETDDDGNYITKSALHINKEVYVMNADGSGQTRLTTDPADDDSPSWSPLGLTILFRSDRERECCDPTAQIWSMNADGTNQIDSSNDGSSNDYSPAATIDIVNTGSQLASSYSGGNQPPVANAGGSYTSQAGQNVQLNGAASFDPDGTIVNYTWNFGDGTSGTGAVANHQYGKSGVYPVSLTVSDNSGNTSSSQGFVTVDSVALPVKITFDDLVHQPPNGTIVADQYFKDYGVRFSSGNFFFPVHTFQNCGPTCGPTSVPNFISTKPDDTGQLVVTFQQSVSNLVFFAVGVDKLSGTFAFVDLYRNGSATPSNTFAMNGNFSPTVGFSSGPLNNIDKLVVRGITDAAGIGFDDFSFTIPADVKITSGRVNGFLNGTTQNALLGADVALNASPMPGAFSGGNYSWTCTSAASPNQCSIVTGNSSSSVTLRMNGLSNDSAVGNYTVTVNYTKGQVSTSGSMTINSVLPSVTGFAGHESVDRINPSGGNPLHPGPCEDIFGFWRYQLGCGTSDEGISFDASVHAPTFISDPTKSGIKYVQVVSAYRQYMQSGNVLCDTKRSSPSNIDSGWQLDDADPYVFDCCPVHYFSEGNDVSMHSHDYPAIALTRVTDYEMIDAAYIDDRFQTYLVYFSNTNPSIQRTLAKVVWNWGGQVVLKWDPVTQTTQHRILSSSTTPGAHNSVAVTSPIVPTQGRVQDNQAVVCQPGVPLTHNLIDSSRVFVRFHYKDFLGRDPAGRNPNDSDDLTDTDLPGWRYWTSQISQCVFDLNCIRSLRINTGFAFFYSAEFIGTDPDLANPPGSPGFNQETYNRAFVRHCYLAYLHREPDPEGWEFWTRSLSEGPDANNYSHMIDAFQVCDDYRNKRTDFTTSAEKF